MILVLGWLGCLYLLVKGLDILSRVDERRDTFARTVASIAAGVAISGALLCLALVLHATGGYGVLWR